MSTLTAGLTRAPEVIYLARVDSVVQDKPGDPLSLWVSLITGPHPRDAAPFSFSLGPLDYPLLASWLGSGELVRRADWSVDHWREALSGDVCTFAVALRPVYPQGAVGPSWHARVMSLWEYEGVLMLNGLIRDAGVGH